MVAAPGALLLLRTLPALLRGAGGLGTEAALSSWQMKGALAEIIQLATLDSDPWVLMVADILKSFPDTGSLNLDLEEQNPNVQDILGELREKGMCACLVCAGRREAGFPRGNVFKNASDLGISGKGSKSVTFQELEVFFWPW